MHPIITVLLVLGMGMQAQALTIALSYDSSVTSLANADAVESAMTYVAQQFQTLYSDPITININVMSVAGTSTLGQSSTYLQYSSFSAITGALSSDSQTANDAMAVANLPSTDPITGAHDYIVPLAQAKALGLRPADDPYTDGIFAFGAGYTYTFDPNNRAVSGAFDFIGLAQHEISEIMGRIPGLGTTAITGVPAYLPYDFFRYSAGVLDMTPGPNDYFSIDGGITNLKNFNNSNGYGGDPQDWASGSNDSFNAYSSSGVENDMSLVDLQALDVMGYDLVPEPGRMVLLVLGVGAALLRRRRPKYVG